jgi:hypothetical protein
MNTPHRVLTKFGGHIRFSLKAGFLAFDPASTHRYSGLVGERKLVSLHKYRGDMTAYQCLVAKKEFARPEGFEPPTF